MTNLGTLPRPLSGPGDLALPIITAEPPARLDQAFVSGAVDSPIGPVPRVPAALTGADRRGAWKVRWSIGRMNYTVDPGLYALGSPDGDSPVLVSANYKLSFDRLRSVMVGRSAWILVLDTKGINVWCAAGKGTFGTDELIKRVAAARLAEVVNHRRLILPQLGAPGVAGLVVPRRTGFRVVYGPVMAEDLPAFLEAGLEATPEMRRKRFPLVERLAVVPVEMVGAGKYVLPLAVAALLTGGLGWADYLAGLKTAGLFGAIALLVGYLAGAVLTPALLPALPGRAFALKGLWAGLVALAGWLALWTGAAGPLPAASEVGGWLALALALASFLGMNFTGASTYTSLSGVRLEMRWAAPAQIAAAALGLVLIIIARWAA